MEKKHLFMTAIFFGIILMSASLIVSCADATQDNAKQEQMNADTSQDADASTTGGMWDPFIEMDRMQEYMDTVFQKMQESEFGRLGRRYGWGQQGIYAPDIDIRESGKNYVVELDLPGMEKDQIAITMEDHMLKVSGERTVSNEEQKKDEDNDFVYYRQERSMGSFQRMIPLPEDAKDEDIAAEYENGVLTVTIPKKKIEKEKPEVKTIKIL